MALLALLLLSACTSATLAGSPDPEGGTSLSQDGGRADPSPPTDEPQPVEPGGGNGGAGDPGSGPDEPIVGEPGPADPAPADGATHVEPEPGIVDARPHAIDHISVAADGRTVTVYWWGGVEACYGLAEVRVERADDGTLSLTVLEGMRPDLGDVACIEIALLKATTITLDAPLFLDGSAD